MATCSNCGKKEVNVLQSTDKSYMEHCIGWCKHCVQKEYSIKKKEARDYAGNLFNSIFK